CGDAGSGAADVPPSRGGKADQTTTVVQVARAYLTLHPAAHGCASLREYTPALIIEGTGLGTVTMGSSTYLPCASGIAPPSAGDPFSVCDWFVSGDATLCRSGGVDVFPTALGSGLQAVLKVRAATGAISNPIAVDVSSFDPPEPSICRSGAVCARADDLCHLG